MILKCWGGKNAFCKRMNFPGSNGFKDKFFTIFLKLSEQQKKKKLLKVSNKWLLCGDISNNN